MPGVLKIYLGFDYFKSKGISYIDGFFSTSRISSIKTYGLFE